MFCEVSGRETGPHSGASLLQFNLARVARIRRAAELPRNRRTSLQKASWPWCVSTCTYYVPQAVGFALKKWQSRISLPKRGFVILLLPEGATLTSGSCQRFLVGVHGEALLLVTGQPGQRGRLPGL